MVVEINYQKRKNAELFKALEGFDLKETQNYIPIYKKFFALNDTNYNGINLNNKSYIKNVVSQQQANQYLCTITRENNKDLNKNVFFKCAPLLDPFKYVMGKYNVSDELLYKLPQLDSTIETTHVKFMDPNNSAYVDGFFSYLTSQLKNESNFVHGLEYYGSFLSIKHNFAFNIFDDLDYLVKSDFFMKNKNVLFHVDDYTEKYSEDDECLLQKLKPIKIDSEVDLSCEALAIDETIFEDVFINEKDQSNNDNDITLSDLTVTNLKEFSFSLEDVEDKKTTTIKSGSTCSSRTSHTDPNDNDNDDNQSECDDSDGSNDDSSSEFETNSDKSNRSGNNNSSEESICEEDEIVKTVIPKFPVQVICMEACEGTLDKLIMEGDEELSDVEWFSILMQIVMILLTYQKAFSFTHNDLHTNNIMYVKTKKEYLYYCYKKKVYRVPTFGKIFKIIDFGRAIYKVNGQLMCSDSFQTGGDAATQYNFEPYYNDKKARIEPNFSFDLCRLGCSIFDYVVEDMHSIKNLKKLDPVTRLIVEWCLDDSGINVLYKNNGDDRYPDFKLYKMISRRVHKHTPEAQLERKEFAAFTFPKNKLPNGENVMNLDNL